MSSPAVAAALLAHQKVCAFCRPEALCELAVVIVKAGERDGNPNISPSGPGRGSPLAGSPVATRAKYSEGREGHAR